MGSSLSNPVNILSKFLIHRIKCKHGHDDKNVKLVELKLDIAAVLEYTNFEDFTIRIAKENLMRR